MSTLLEKLKVKPPQIKKEQYIELRLDEQEDSNDDVMIEDLTKTSKFNHEGFMEDLMKLKYIQTLPEKYTKNIPELKKKEVDLELIDDIVKTKKKKTKSVIANKPIDNIFQYSLGDELIENRMPEKEPPVYIKKSKYYLNNREVFVNDLQKMFYKYREEVKDDSQSASCDDRKDESAPFKLLTHQKIVRDYLNVYTPYRGLLLYHGLGSGKTCSSIAIAEGILTTASIAYSESVLSDRKIIIMTPASLRKNYISELKKCANPIYKKKQYWEFVKIEGKPELGSILSNVLHLPLPYITKKNGAWMVNAKKSSNYESLSSDEKTSLEEQLDQMIDQKYLFLNYNGLRKSKYNELTKNGSHNIFSNKVIVIDEAHNFVSRIVNKLDKLPTKYDISKKDDKFLSLMMYRDLMMAENVKIVMLTGTPIINFPNEISIMFNMLRGFIKTWNIQLESKSQSSIQETQIMKAFKTDKLCDLIQLNGNILQITRNPYGFINEYKKDNYEGMKLDDNPHKNWKSDKAFIEYVKKTLLQNNINIVAKSIKVNNYKLLPDRLVDFSTKFIDKSNGDLKNENLLKKRIIGLTSYFKSAQESLMPTFNYKDDFYIEHIDMSDFQFEQYEKIRIEERKVEKKSKKPQQNNVDDLFKDSNSTYKIFSRAACNFVFPNPPRRPMPNDSDSLAGNMEQIGDEDRLDGIQKEQQLESIDGRIDMDDVEDTEKTDEIEILSYAKRIEKAMEELEKGASSFFSKEGLEMYTPKLLKCFENINDTNHEGLHMFYSQFRTLEGIGIFSLILKSLGYNKIKLIRNSSQQYELDETNFTLNKMFALYTGTESVEEKETIRNIYNGDWDVLPSKLREQLKNHATNNQMGSIIKVFMITASGAEGINLKNTRFVHILEPYWHPTRIHQIIGRARRICSHNDLEDKYKNVRVFMYLMTFTDKQIKDGSIELKTKDISKYDPKNKRPLTSDEMLYEIMQRKEDINKQIIQTVKETAMDCFIHNNDSSEALECYHFHGNENVSDFSYTPNIEKDEYDKKGKAQALNITKGTYKFGKVEINGKAYVILLGEDGRPTNEVYDYDSYKAAKRNPNQQVIKVGVIEKDDDGNMKLNKN